MSRADLCFVVGGPVRARPGRAGARRQQAVVRPDDPSAPARAGGPARAAVSRAQDPGRRAVPLLTRLRSASPGRGCQPLESPSASRPASGCGPAALPRATRCASSCAGSRCWSGSVAAARAGRRRGAGGFRGRLLLARHRPGRSTRSPRSARSPTADTLGGDVTKVVLTIFGVGTMFFVLVTLTELFVAGDLSGLLDERRMQSKIAQLKDHYLICGFGRVGRQVAKDLRAGGRAVRGDRRQPRRARVRRGGWTCC